MLTSCNCGRVLSNKKIEYTVFSRNTYMEFFVILTGLDLTPPDWNNSVFNLGQGVLLNYIHMFTKLFKTSVYVWTKWPKIIRTPIAYNKKIGIYCIFGENNLFFWYLLLPHTPKSPLHALGPPYKALTHVQNTFLNSCWVGENPVANCVLEYQLL
jgi:hypothetical protein